MDSENYLYLPEASPEDCQLVENLGFSRLDPASFKWSVPGTRELISDFKPVNSDERGFFGSRTHPYVAREVHYVYRNAQGEPILWSCIAEVYSGSCMCFGRQYAISVTGPCKFKARRHVHVHGPPPTAAELEAREAAHFALEQQALAGDKRAQFMIGMGDATRRMQERANADFIRALKNAYKIANNREGLVMERTINRLLERDEDGNLKIDALNDLEAIKMQSLEGENCNVGEYELEAFRADLKAELAGAIARVAEKHRLGQ